MRGDRARRVRHVLAIAGPLLLVALVPPLLDCGGTDSGRCPLVVPTDNALCNSGGVVVYCHYDCAADAGTTYYATCSGPRWSVVASGLDCMHEAGTD